MKRSAQQGVSVVELVLTVGLVAIVTGLAVPSFGAMLAQNRLTAAANELVASLQFARFIAINGGGRGTLCALAETEDECSTAAGFTRGWIVFADRNGDGALGSDETVRRVVRYRGTDVSITGNTPVSRYVSYTSSGVTRTAAGAFQAGTITLCNVQGGRRVVISAVGRARVEAADSC